MGHLHLSSGRRVTRFARKALASAVGVACIAILSSGCQTKSEALPKPAKPFDPAAIHQPVAITPGDKVIFLTAGPDIEYQAQNAALSALPGTTIVFPPGVHKFNDEFIVNTSHITLAGAGLNATVLDFGDQETGAQGILGLGDHFTVQDLAVVNPAGDAIRIEGVDGVTIRRVRVEWTSRGDENNGAYGLYPVLSDNVLIEDSVAIGASDAGVYVGQSKNIIVRRNTVEYNVAGIEIENSQDADVYDNWTAHNTAGILVFDLPGLVRKGGQSTHIFDNVVWQNTTHSFAPAGNIVGLVPSGVGIMVMANDNVEVDHNLVRDHGTASVTVVDYRISGNSFDDPEYDPTPETINIHDNQLEREPGIYRDGNDLNTAVNLLYKFKDPAEIIYDGIGEDPSPLPEGKKICFRNNLTQAGELARFGNLNFQNINDLGIPTGPVTSDVANHDCSYDSLPAIVIPPAPPAPEGNGSTTIHCEDTVSGVNWAAAGSDCTNLAHYNLFADPTNPLTGENSNGVPYDLTTPLFSDYSRKQRQVFVPPGKTITYNEDELVYPTGTIITKTFYYVDDETNPQAVNLMETRLLINRGEHGWMRLPYIWNDGVATLALGGGTKEVSWIDAAGASQSTQYGIPNINQCSSCHGAQQTDKPQGPEIRRLNDNYDYGSVTENQITHWANVGILSGAPADPRATAPRHPVWNNPTDGTLQERAMAYLESNCGHCHNNEGGRAASTGLWLKATETLDSHIGICKTPIAAGTAAGDLDYDLVPGNPDQSIMVYRMNSVAPAVKMPELAKTMVHVEGVQLIRDWIATLPGTCP